MALVTQAIPRVIPFLAFGSASQAFGFSDGIVFSGAVHPIPIAGTVKSLAVRKDDFIPAGDLGEYSLVQVYKNGVFTGLGLTIHDFDDQVYIATNVSVAAGNYLHILISSQGAIASPGYTLGVTTVWESLSGMVFGITAFGGSVTAGDHFLGGALGNGIFQNRSGSSLAVSNTYSICALECWVTRLMLQRYSTNSGGAWVGRLIVDEILQDGSPGTVDTTVTIDDTDDDTAFFDFLLPLTKQQRVDCIVTRTGTSVGFAGAHIGVGVAVVPMNDGEFMFTGGSNDTVVGNDTSWKWNHSRQAAVGESLHTAPSGPSKFTVTGMYVDHDPGGSGTFTDTLQKNGDDTDLATAITAPDSSGFDTGTAVYLAGNTITIKSTGLDVAETGARLHWGIGATTVDIDIPVPPPMLPQGNIGPIAWLKTARRQP